MQYKIIGDSCLDLTPELEKDSHFTLIPFTIMIEDRQFIDDETFDQQEFFKVLKASPECPKTACPSPEMYRDAFLCEEENIFVITISSELSGSYNSAVLARNLYEEEYGSGKNICIIDSRTASSGQLNIAMRLMELCEQDLSFEEIEKEILKYRDELTTYFVLESLDTLRKNGRLNGIQAFFASALNIKPVMGGDKGVIVKIDQARGIQKALQKMAEILVKNVPDKEKKRLVIAHCNNPERAEYMKSKLLEQAQFRDVVITSTRGLATVYANDGGIVVTL